MNTTSAAQNVTLSNTGGATLNITGIAITGALWGWGRPNWGGGSVNVNVNRFNSINQCKQYQCERDQQSDHQFEYLAA